MSSILRQLKSRDDAKTRDKTTLMIRNGAIVLRELIAASHGKYNPYRIFSAEELKLATNNYGSEKVVKQPRQDLWNKYCDTYKLYKGFWQERSISVMKFHNNGDEFAYRFCINNIVYASQMNHKHIIKLIGCCLETNIPILVFDSVECGTLADRIFSGPQPQFKPLLLTHRLKIAMDIAHAIAYLHFGFPRRIIFRDIKPSNILFNEQNDAKLFDFSLSMSIPEGETHVHDEMWGVLKIPAPEGFSTADYSEKLDVFIFGTFLLYLLTGQKGLDLARGNLDGVESSFLEHLKKHVEKSRLEKIIAPLIEEDLSCPGKGQQLKPLVQLIVECLNFSPVDRPTMIDIAKRLRQIYRSCM